MALEILNKKQTQEILEILNQQFGIKKLPKNSIFIKRGKEKIFLYKGNFSKEKIKNLEEKMPIEGAGVYIGKIDERTNEIRLTIEATQIFKEQITKNIFEINEEQLEKWMHGQEILLSEKEKSKIQQKTFVVIKYKNDFIGTGKASEEKITNFIPKNRRLKFRN